MLAKDTVSLKSLRNMLAAFTNELVAKSRKPTETLSDEEALLVVQRMVKKAKKAIELFKQGGRADLMEEEEAEIKIFESYLNR